VLGGFRLLQAMQGYADVVMSTYLAIYCSHCCGSTGRPFPDWEKIKYLVPVAARFFLVEVGAFLWMVRQFILKVKMSIQRFGTMNFLTMHATF
jgi:hypothetical protein